MPNAPSLPGENDRIEELVSYSILDTPREPAFDRLTALTAAQMKVPICVMSLVDKDRIWFKSTYGVSLSEIERLPGFCNCALHEEGLYVVKDASTDPCACTHPWVEMGFRFYAGFPLRTKNNFKLGYLSVIDFVPRTLSPEEGHFLEVMAAVVMDQLALRRLTFPAKRDAESLGRIQVDSNFRKSDAQLAWAFEFAAVGMALIKTEPGSVILRVNRSLCALLGYAEEEMLTKTLAEISYPEDMPENLEKQRQLLEGKIQSFAMDKRYIRKDGHVIWALLNVSLVRDDQGQPLMFIGQVQDRTEQTLARQALEENEKRWRFAVEGTGDGAWDWDVRSDRVILSSNWQEFLGIRNGLAATWFGSWMNRVHPEDQASANQAISDCVHGINAKYQNEHRICGADGSWKHVLARAVVIQRDENGHSLRMVGSFSDITERKLLEEQLRQSQKMELVGRLAGGVSHDFNNILSAMTLNLEVLRATHPELENDDVFPEVKELVEQGARLTQQLLAFSRQQPLSRQPLDLHLRLANLLRLLTRLIGDNITMSLSAEAGSSYVEADAGMLDQAFMNLSLNARDAMPKGGKLMFKTSNTQYGGANSGKFICISVRDTGVGMSPETLSKIFEPFFTTKEVGKGTGLGLASSNGIVHQHGGWITVQSKLGEGTEFFVYLPLTEKIPYMNPSEKRPRESLPEQKRKATILLVEDHEIVRRVTIRILEMAGYRVIPTCDGLEALSLWDVISDEVDLLISDMMMPGGLTGMDLSERMRKKNPHLPVLIVSGYSEDLLSKAKNISLLPKPFETETLLQMVEQCLAD